MATKNKIIAALEQEVAEAEVAARAATDKLASLKSQLKRFSEMIRRPGRVKTPRGSTTEPPSAS